MPEDTLAMDLEDSAETAATDVTAKPKEKRSSKAAKRTFPKYSIEESRKIAEAIKQYNAGNPWSPAEIASTLKVSARGSDFFYLSAASRDYGLTLGTRDAAKIDLTPLGNALVYPKSPSEEAEAVRQSFRNVELFRSVYDYYQGENLPEIQYLKQHAEEGIRARRIAPG